MPFHSRNVQQAAPSRRGVGIPACRVGIRADIGTRRTSRIRPFAEPRKMPQSNQSREGIQPSSVLIPSSSGARRLEQLWRKLS